MIFNRSLCTFVKDEAHCIENMLHSALPYCDELVLVDTGSSDKTIEVATEYCNSINKPIRVYQVGFTNFGSIRTLTAHLANYAWVLMLDADETISNSWYLSQYQDKEYLDGTKAWAFPRKRWLDINRVTQVELNAYPDYQVRFFRNDKSFIWRRELHEEFHGAEVKHSLDSGLPEITINHFHDVHKSPEDLVKRKVLYTELAQRAGVTVEGGHRIGSS